MQIEKKRSGSAVRWPTIVVILLVLGTAGFTVTCFAKSNRLEAKAAREQSLDVTRLEGVGKVLTNLSYMNKTEDPAISGILEAYGATRAHLNKSWIGTPDITVEYGYDRASPRVSIVSLRLAGGTYSLQRDGAFEKRLHRAVLDIGRRRLNAKIENLDTQLPENRQ